MERIVKQCSKCKTIKPINEFYNDKYCKDGKTFRCKNCYAEYQKSEKGRNVYRKALKKYSQTEKGKAAARRSDIIHRARHPVHVKARMAIANATLGGEIPPVSELQCSDCYNQAEQYHHYNGYKKEHWLDITPLCKECHSSRHTT